MCRSYSEYNTSTSRAIVYFMTKGLQRERVTCEKSMNNVVLKFKQGFEEVSEVKNFNIVKL